MFTPFEDASNVIARIFVRLDFPEKIGLEIAMIILVHSMASGVFCRCKFNLPLLLKLSQDVKSLLLFNLSSFSNLSSLDQIIYVSAKFPV